MNLCDTRLDPKDRLELITNRISYVTAELEKWQDELIVLTREKELLVGLMDLYAEAPERIDDERAAMVKRQSNGKVVGLAKPSAEHTIVSLLATGQASRQDLISASGLTPSSISSALHRLVRKGMVIHWSKGIYRLPPTGSMDQVAEVQHV